MSPHTSLVRRPTRSRQCVRPPQDREGDSAGRLECRWQREQLPDAVRELVLEDQRLRNEILLVGVRLLTGMTACLHPTQPSRGPRPERPRRPLPGSCWGSVQVVVLYEGGLGGPGDGRLGVAQAGCDLGGDKFVLGVALAISALPGALVQAAGDSARSPVCRLVATCSAMAPQAVTSR